MCGEHLDAGSEQKPCPGSSPHVRGAPQAAAKNGVENGIIPACAGSTATGRWTWNITRDHPRMCGEHALLHMITRTLSGSSPHVRGAHPSIVASIAVTGIIPACAGSTTRCRSCPPAIRDHPRMCGEHLRPPGRTRTVLGSSPHVRGARRGHAMSTMTAGIIPACAGSTLTGGRAMGRIWDHPRMCGEHVRMMRVTAVKWGSSPHVRGAPMRVAIPIRSNRDHPRMCGEHMSSERLSIIQSGSSPHVRGARVVF